MKNQTQGKPESHKSPSTQTQEKPRLERYASDAERHRGLRGLLTEQAKKRRRETLAFVERHAAPEQVQYLDEHIDKLLRDWKSVYQSNVREADCLLN